MECANILRFNYICFSLFPFKSTISLSLFLGQAEPVRVVICRSRRREARGLHGVDTKVSSWYYIFSHSVPFWARNKHFFFFLFSFSRAPVKYFTFMPVVYTHHIASASTWNRIIVRQERRVCCYMQHTGWLLCTAQPRLDLDVWRKASSRVLARQEFTLTAHTVFTLHYAMMTTICCLCEFIL